MNPDVALTCGQLIVAGFSGTSVPPRFARALARGERGGAVVFKRNVTQEVVQVASLTAALKDAAGDRPPLIAVDQEGGRVARLAAVLAVPPMAVLGARLDAQLVERVASAQARQLAALGFTTGFSPVLDVATQPANPVIGDRAFGAAAELVARMGVAWARGLRAQGLLACGKHYPGHGDTTTDSHVDLPRVDHGRARLDAVELLPFRAAAAAGIDMLMTAHVLYPALDGVPATLSYEVCTRILREELRFGGVLVSDDLEMGALRGRYAVDDAAVLAVEAGCDVVLVCASEDLADATHAALVRRAERDASFLTRCREAAARGAAMRARVPPRPLAGDALVAAMITPAEVQHDLADLARGSAS